MSPSFLGLAIASALCLAVLGGAARQLVFLAANVLFVGGMLLSPEGAVSTVLFIIFGYVLVQWILRGSRLSLPVGLTVYILFFVYLRNYDFLGWVLPANAISHNQFATVGLSFLFFKIVHVMIEASSGTLGPIDFLTYSNYSLNFTTFMMGPIQRYQDYAVQWSGREQAIAPTMTAHIDAVLRVLVGLVKAYVIADRLGAYALLDSADLLTVSRLTLMGRVYAFYFFLYFNFAGYCDVVIGLGSLMGIRPPENFDKPFLARNISDFWFRFHRSLTQWLTNYVFTPVYKKALTSSFFGARPLLAMNAALLLTMVVSGLWHGTTISFLLFGLVHGLLFVVFRTWESLAAKRFGKPWLRKWRQRRMVHLLSVVATLTAVALSLVFFRLDAGLAMRVFARLLGL